MKKKLFGLIALLIIVVIALFHVNIATKANMLSDTSLANAEALAQGEIIVGPICKSVQYDWCDITLPGDPYKEWMVPWKNVY